MSLAVFSNRFITETATYSPMVAKPMEATRGACCTHTFINEQAGKILFNDGYIKVFKFFNMFASQLDEGVVWVDSGLKSACHYYDPDTGSGMLFWPSAVEKCSDFFSKAMNMWQRKKHNHAMFFLGAAVHLVQDLCVPHHAVCKVLGSHLRFENWVEKRKFNYRVDIGGIYDLSDNPRDWIVENAKYSKNYFFKVEDNSPEGYHVATTALLPRAQQTTAGLLLLFYNIVNM